jgi:hypothetical protein
MSPPSCPPAQDLLGSATLLDSQQQQQQLPSPFPFRPRYSLPVLQGPFLPSQPTKLFRHPLAVHRSDDTPAFPPCLPVRRPSVRQLPRGERRKTLLASSTVFPFPTSRMKEMGMPRLRLQRSSQPADAAIQAPARVRVERRAVCGREGDEDGRQVELHLVPPLGLAVLSDVSSRISAYVRACRGGCSM